MKIAVLGCGAIGGLFLGYLQNEDVDIIGVVRDYQKSAIDKEGLLIEGLAGHQKIMVNTVTRLTQKVDLAVFACKINDLEMMIDDNLNYLKDAVVVSTQNGVYADHILKKYFIPEKIITGSVMFGATFYPPNKVVHNFPGELVVGNMFNAPIEALTSQIDVLRKVFRVSLSPNIKGAKYLKVFVNLNNCLPAILGKSIQETYADIDMARLAILLNREAYSVVQKAGVVLENIPNYPKERLEGLLRMTIDDAAAILSKTMVGLSKEPLYGSILQSIQRSKKSEIDYINGEIVRLARENGFNAPLNEQIVDLVHDVEDAGAFLAKRDLEAILEGEL